MSADHLRGALVALAGLGVRALGFAGDEDGNPGVTVIRPFPYDVRSHTTTSEVMADPDKAVEWAICVAAFERGVRA